MTKPFPRAAREALIDLICRGSKESPLEWWGLRTGVGS